MPLPKASPLLALLDSRWNDFIKKIPDPSDARPTPRPMLDANYRRDIEIAARSHAEAHNADPFAWGRARRYMQQGYWLPSEVSQDARGITASRRNQGITFPAAKGD